MKRKTKLIRKKKPKQIPKVLQVDYSTHTIEELRVVLNEKQRVFCHRYIRHWNQAKAAREAGYSERTSTQMGSENMAKPYIRRYIDLIQQDIAREVGVSKIGLLSRLANIANASLTDVFTDWITQGEYDKVIEEHPEIKDAIQEISSKTESRLNEYKDLIQVNYVKIKLYDKLGAIEKIFKGLGWNAPDKIDVTLEQPLFPDTTED